MNVTPSLTHAFLPASDDLSGLGARVARHAGGEASLHPGTVLFDPQSGERIP